MATATGVSCSDAPSATSFPKLRPICVRLLRLSVLPPNDPAIPPALAELHACLSTCTTLSPALIHYVFYPLSELLRTHESSLFSFPDKVRSLIFSVLHQLARDWWRAWTWEHVCAHNSAVPTTTPRSITNAPDWRVWEQLLFLGIMTLSGGPASAPVRNSDETRYMIMQFLSRMLEPRTSIPSLPSCSQSAAWEWDGTSDLPSLDDMDGPRQLYPSIQQVAAARESRACSGALAHILKLALDTARDTSATDNLRLLALDLACITTITWMGGCTGLLDDAAQLNLSALRIQNVDADFSACSERLRPFLPGVASSLVKVATSNRTHAPIVARAIDMLSAMLVMCLDDSLTAAYRPAPPTYNLPSKLEDFASLDWGMQPSNTDSERDSDTISDQSDPSTPATSVRDDALELPWFEQTMPPLLLVIQALTSLHERDDAPVQLALARSAHLLLLRMHETLEWARQDTEMDPCEALTCCLLDLAHPSNAKTVVECARHAVQDTGSIVLSVLDRVLDIALSSLSGSITRVHDTFVRMHADRVAACVSVLSRELRDVQFQSINSAFLRLASSDAQFERWIDPLARALSMSSDALELIADDSVPHVSLVLADLEPSTMDALALMWSEWGQATAIFLQYAVQKGSTVRYQDVFALPLYMMESARLCRLTDIARARALLFAMNEMMLGMSGLFSARDTEVWMALPQGRAIRKAVHAFARRVVQSIQHAWQAELEEPNDFEQPRNKLNSIMSASPTQDTELLRGMPMHEEPALPVKTGPALDVSFVESARIESGMTQRAAPEKLRIERARERYLKIRDHCDAISLCVLASAVSLLGVSCRPLLLHILYPVLGALGRRSELVRRAAQYALECMADACAYPDVRSCVLHHTDYVLGAASHRLVSGLRTELYAGVTIDSIEPAPTTALMSARAAPWVLVQIIEMLGIEALPWVEDAVEEVLTALDQFHGHEDVCDGLLAVLARLVAVMAPVQSMNPTPAPRSSDAIEEFRLWIQRSSSTANDLAEAPANTNVPDQDTNEDPNPPPDRLQTVVSDILARCVPFLSHVDAHLRVRALDMLRDGVKTLAPQNRTAELYPVLDRAWPLILTRLGTSFSSAGLQSESDLNVWIHATMLVSAVGQCASDGFGRRILKDVWPRWNTMLHDQRGIGKLKHARISYAALLPNNTPAAAQREQHATRIGLYDEHATNGRIVRAIVEALTSVITSLGERTESAALWDMATHPVLIDTLDARQPPTIRQAGAFLYSSFIRADSMAVWIVLRAVAGQGPPYYLQRPIHWAPELTW